MRIVRHWQSTPADARGAVVAIGNFDGVHLGHRAVIEEGRRMARSLGAPLAVLTFEPHPRQVLNPPDGPFRLTPFRVKARHLAALGVEVLYVARFDRAFAAREPASFVADVIAAGIGARHVVVGHDFAFGRRRAGTVSLLTEVGTTLGVGVTTIEAAGTGTEVYSASQARRLLAAGEVAALPPLLGRFWEIEGRVIAGDRRGRTIGFPTANLRCAGILHPARGVYALWARPDGDEGHWLPAVANLGRRPTFDKTEDLLEVHIFDYAGNLYGRRLRAAFAERVRPERRFDGIDALKAQIASDCEAARAILAGTPAPDAGEAATPAPPSGNLMTADYRDTVLMPRTGFPMKARLPEREPDMAARWENIGLYRRLREESAGRPKFVLHDGPPYANGHLHLGTALNKILKDVVVRSQQMLGKDSVYVPGWDCHGLPIEWQVEQAYRKEGRDKDSVAVSEFRADCRAFAEHWIDVQRSEFKRLGVIGDWDDPYTTMSFAAEAQIVRELGRFLLDGSLYRGARPVMWSPVEKTALAEAEIEYHDHKSVVITVAFPVIESPLAALDGASVVIWTTTPWTIPGNRCIAYGEALSYQVLEVEAVADGAQVVPGARIACAETLAPALCKDTGIAEHRVIASGLPGAAFAGTLCAHPLRGRGYDFPVPLIPADHVTTEQGTGFVHIAPGHGAEDFEAVAQWNAAPKADQRPVETPATVDDDGCFYDHVPEFAGKHVYKVNGEVADALAEAGRLLARGTLVHSYPHSWRSKAPLIFRNTLQWFISMETTGLRQTALDAIDRVRWVPPAGRARIRSMIETRPDWVLSRQRVWGVPIAVFVSREDGAALRDPAVVERIAAIVEAEGADAWFTSDKARFLAPEHEPEAYDKVTDILDVWFESGTTHSFVLEKRPELMWPASLYLEGSDQHRGWFHSSLLESCGTRGRAPYDAVLTHGFVVDGEGRKMSKSLGNVIAPQQVNERYGADILRLWVVSADYAEDLRISEEILRYQADSYRRLRNTLRFLLGNLSDFHTHERLAAAELPALERWVLHRLHGLDRDVRRWCEDFAFHEMFVALHHFCAVDLSAFYFDIRKDSLYCDPVDSPRRRAVRTVLDSLFDCLTAWLAPFICFTAEEAWLARHPDDESVHLRVFPALPAEWQDDALAERMERTRAVRRVVTKALEQARAAKTIGSSLEAAPAVFVHERYRDALAYEDDDCATLFITSDAVIRPWNEAPEDDSLETLPEVPEVGVLFAPAEHAKCARCWRLLPEVGGNERHPELCRRCVGAVEAARPAAA